MNNLYHIPSSEKEDIVIFNGCYGSRYFEITTFMGHPNAYVGFPEGNYIKDYDDIPVPVHGGFTFLGKRSGELMLGWDYNHLGDFCALDAKLGGKKWSLSSILAEVISAIDELNSIY
jgi:hypothetical protein